MFALLGIIINVSNFSSKYLDYKITVLRYLRFGFGFSLPKWNFNDIKAGFNTQNLWAAADSTFSRQVADLSGREAGCRKPFLGIGFDAQYSQNLLPKAYLFLNQCQQAGVAVVHWKTWIYKGQNMRDENQVLTNLNMNKPALQWFVEQYQFKTSRKIRRNSLVDCFASQQIFVDIIHWYL